MRVAGHVNFHADIPTIRGALDQQAELLFDAIYANPGGSEQVVSVIPQNRRNVRLSLQVRF